MRKLVLALVCALAVAGTAVPSSAAAGSPTWAPVDSASVRPGVPVQTSSGGCTTNFVFYERFVDASGRVRFDVLMGLAAHCFSLGGSTQTNACTTPSRPLGSHARVEGAAYPAILVYSSWITAQQAGERNANVCATNDFALVRLDPRDHRRVNPSVLAWGGPHGIRTGATAAGEKVYSYGSSSLRLGLTPTSPKRGVAVGTSHGGWNHQVYTATPGIPGDSGSAVLDQRGRALGVLVTLQAAPLAASNGITDLGHALAYANGKTGHRWQLADGTRGFDTPPLP
ncbi:MAG TPA: trypsin-like peptidase domain-containing protein [Mycobacteriales bacterium]|nr:trypsin-like peptidase domain-containing protein [Mycobacteriales bacterium]